MDFEKWAGLVYCLLPSQGAQKAPALWQFVTQTKIQDEAHKQKMISELLEVINSYAVTQREINEASEFVKLLLTTTLPKPTVECNTLTAEAELRIIEHIKAWENRVTPMRVAPIKKKWRVVYNKYLAWGNNLIACHEDLESEGETVNAKQIERWEKELATGDFGHINVIAWSALD